MDLELIARKPQTPLHATPLLFVHGAWHGAWCWDEHFLSYFAEQGYNAYALSLRGHGGSDGRDRLRFTSLASYVDDVAQVARGLSALPALIGHSMGGAVVQKYLETHAAPAAILLASVPAAGAWRTTLRFARRLPLPFLKANLTLSLYPLIDTPERTRAAFFSADMPEAEVQRYFPRMQDESYRVFLDILLLNLPRPRRVRAPILALGAADDTVFSPDEVEATARAYGSTARIFPGMAHDMMLEAGWRAVADCMRDWLAERGL